jgi:outer membrane protein
MKINMKFLLAPALALMSCAGLFGQATKVALINMQEAIANTKDGQAQIAELDKKYGPKQQEFQKRAADIQAKQDQLKKTQNTISDEARATMEADITRMKTALQRDTDDAQADSDQDQQKMMQGVGAKVVQAVTKYSQDNQIMLVFDLSSQPNNLICCASAPDITREVIALTDKMSAGGSTAAAPAAKPATPAAPRPATPAPKPAGPTAPAK